MTTVSKLFLRLRIADLRSERVEEPYFLLANILEVYELPESPCQEAL